MDVATTAGLKPVYRFKGTEGYVRAVVTDSNGKKAWTQPVFLDRRAKVQSTKDTSMKFAGPRLR